MRKDAELEKNQTCLKIEGPQNAKPIWRSPFPPLTHPQRESIWEAQFKVDHLKERLYWRKKGHKYHKQGMKDRTAGKEGKILALYAAEPHLSLCTKNQQDWFMSSETSEHHWVYSKNQQTKQKNTISIQAHSPNTTHLGWRQQVEVL